MAVKRYISNTDAIAGFTLPATTGYGVIGSSSKSDLTVAPSGAGAASQAAETLTTQPVLLLARRFLSDQMTTTGNFGGAWNAVIARNSNNSAADMYFRMVLRIFSADGSAERGSAYVYEDPVEMGQTLTGTAYSGTIPTVACQAGDRILMELGAKSINVSATSYQVTIRRGGTDLTDMVAGDTANASIRPSWINFSDAMADARFAAAAPTVEPGRMFVGYGG